MPVGAAARLEAAAARLGGLSRPRRWALGASVLWAVVVLAYGLGYLGVAAATPGRGMVFLDGLLFLLALALPLVLVWLAAALAEEMERQRAVVAALAEAAVPLAEALERAGDRQGVAPPPSPPASDEALRAAVRAVLAETDRGAALARAIERVAAGQQRLLAMQEALAATPARRTAAAAAAPEHAPEAVAAPAAPAPEPPGAGDAADQPGLPHLPMVEAAAERLDWADLVRALDFPRDGNDREGFRALEAALRHRPLAQMLQAAEDVLTMLSQEGVYMEDLAVAPVDPRAWRSFIRGVRGPQVAAMAGITDAGALDSARALLRSDPVFRDTALFFQRRFDAVLAERAADAGDAELVQIAGTRSGRAFMLLVRLSGALD